ncbi:MarR family transcriptional regulator [Natrinema zhouii]|uniref:MarR family transcriptional regulator n=1 Tax=Natrinema zhouii TaxID=1710539 RepID=A0A7D6GSB7_9EURY|nr:helix-turn-helix domain-containing protein [Natrinema zhouii]QLK26743.1 MarR family transcriptional regulator [Natrinema zhouii]
MSATDSEQEADGATEADDRSAETAETIEGDENEEPAADRTLADLPPSAKLVYKVLEYEGPMTQERIAAESRLCPRTVRYALGKLEDGGIVTSRVCLEDARQSTYRIGE